MGSHNLGAMASEDIEIIGAISGEPFHSFKAPAREGVGGERGQGFGFRVFGWFQSQTEGTTIYVIPLNSTGPSLCLQGLYSQGPGPLKCY